MNQPVEAFHPHHPKKAAITKVQLIHAEAKSNRTLPVIECTSTDSKLRSHWISSDLVHQPVQDLVIAETWFHSTNSEIADRTPHSLIHAAKNSQPDVAEPLSKPARFERPPQQMALAPTAQGMSTGARPPDPRASSPAWHSPGDGMAGRSKQARCNSAKPLLETAGRGEIATLGPTHHE